MRERLLHRDLGHDEDGSETASDDLVCAPVRKRPEVYGCLFVASSEARADRARFELVEISVKFHFLRRRIPSIAWVAAYLIRIASSSWSALPTRAVKLAPCSSAVLGGRPLAPS